MQDNSLAEFARLSLKLEADGHVFEQEMSAERVRFTILRCPWLELLRRSGRVELAGTISKVICPTECEAWCREFGGEVAFELPARACLGGERCEMVFTRG